MAKVGFTTKDGTVVSFTTKKRSTRKNESTAIAVRANKRKPAKRKPAARKPVKRTTVSRSSKDKATFKFYVVFRGPPKGLNIHAGFATQQAARAFITKKFKGTRRLQVRGRPGLVKSGHNPKVAANWKTFSLAASLKAAPAPRRRKTTTRRNTTATKPAKKSAVKGSRKPAEKATTRLNPEQVAQMAQLLGGTDLPAFKKWFRGSKVIAGEKPLRLYHGTVEDFDTFSYAKYGKGKGARAGRGGKGFYFTPERGLAAEHASVRFHKLGLPGKPQPRILDVYLKMENPLYVNTFEELPEYVGEDMSVGEAAALQREVRKMGHDGIIKMPNHHTNWTEEDWEYYEPEFDDKDYGDDEIEYIVFKPTQIKSASKNRGTFDPNDPNIYHNPARREATAPKRPTTRSRR